MTGLGPANERLVNRLARWRAADHADAMTVDSASPIQVARDEIELQISRVEERLAADFASAVTPELVSEQVRDVRAEFVEARITQFVPILIESLTRQRLLQITRRP